MKNTGKIFENQFTKYFPDYCLVYKIPDSTANFSGSKLSYSVKNPFDYFTYDSRRKNVICLELKTVEGNSISFERAKEEEGKKKIHYHQIMGLKKFQSYGLESGFVIEFRSLSKTVYINILDFDHLMDATEKKSFNYSDLEKLEIRHIEIPQEKLKVNYKYDIEYFLNEINRRIKDEI